MYVLELSKRLVQRGHQVLVVTSKLPGTPEHEYIEGIEVLRIDGHYFPKVPYFLFILNFGQFFLRDTHIAPLGLVFGNGQHFYKHSAPLGLPFGVSEFIFLRVASV